MSASPSDGGLRGVEPFHFSGPRHELFGCYHAPAGAPREHAFVLACAHGHEYVQFHRVFRQLALMLSEAGFPVLRFDFSGCGDSYGDEGDWSPRDWGGDLGAALDEARRRSGLNRLGLLGLRLGGSIAYRQSVGREDVEGLVLWDPVLDGAAYLAEMRRLHVSMLRYAHVRPEKKPTREEVLGFALPEALAAELSKLDLLSGPVSPAKSILVVESNEGAAQAPFVEHLERSGGAVRHEAFANPHLWVWTEDFAKVHVPHKILTGIVRWATEELG